MGKGRGVGVGWKRGTVAPVGVPKGPALEAKIDLFSELDVFSTFTLFSRLVIINSRAFSVSRSTMPVVVVAIGVEFQNPDRQSTFPSIAAIKASWEIASYSTLSDKIR